MKMFDNFKNIDKDYIPNNTFTQGWQADNQIVRFADCDHIFIVEGDYVGFVDTFKVIYKQSFIKLIKSGEDLDIEIIDGNTYVRTHLIPEETKIFDYRYPVISQIEIKLLNGETIFSKKSEIKVINSVADTYEGVVVQDVSVNEEGE